MGDNFQVVWENSLDREEGLGGEGGGQREKNLGSKVALLSVNI